jgi:D-amino-acid dehydrogenase
LLDWVHECFPDIDTRSVVPWAGLRPMMPDMLPRVGRGKAPNVFYNTGHGHLGWTLAAATAEMVSQDIERALPCERTISHRQVVPSALRPPVDS